MTNVNSIKPSEELPPADEIKIDEGTELLNQDTMYSFTLMTNKSVESMLLLCRGVNEFGSLSASRILYVHGEKYSCLFGIILNFHPLHLQPT